MAAISQNSRTYPFGAADRLNVDPRLIDACATDPVLRVRLPYGGDAWLVTRYAEIKTVLSDPTIQPRRRGRQRRASP